MDKVNIYIHTNIKSVRAKSGGAYIWVVEAIINGQPATITKKADITATSKEAELTAFVEALGRLNRPCEITLYLENANTAAAFNNNWLTKWKEQSWKNSKGEEIKCAALWQQTDEKMSPHTLVTATTQEHSYTSWMLSELGEKSRELENVIFTQKKAIGHIMNSIESLDASVIESDPVLQKSVFELTERLFEKFAFLQSESESEFEESENPESGILLQCEEITENANLEIMVH